MKLPNNMLALLDRYSEQFRQSFVTLIDSSLIGNPEHCSAELISSVTDNLSKASREACRKALEGFIQEFEPAPDTSPIHKDGIRYRFNRRSPKNFLTQFGPIELQRNLHYPSEGSGKKAYCPLDEAWEMNGRFAAPEVVEAVLMASASGDPKEIKGLLRKLAGISLSAEAIYDIRTEEGGAMHDWVQTEEGLQARLETCECPQETSAFVVGLDGVNLPLREPGPKRGRPRERPTSDSHGDMQRPKQSCFKNAMVGSYSHYGVAEVIDIRGGTKRNEAARLQSIYTAQMPQERFVDFKAEFEATLDRLESRLPEDVRKVLLLDGGRPLWGYLEDRSERFSSYEWLLDFYHTTEHLSQAAETLFGKKSPAGARWYQNWRDKLKSDEWAVDGLIRSMNYHRRKRKLSRSMAKIFEQQLGYFRRNRQWMNYADFLKRNLPIGSGPTEAACKTIVKERMCRSGMRWNREKGRSVLTLRAISKSGQWEQTWKEYRRRQWKKAA